MRCGGSGGKRRGSRSKDVPTSKRSSNPIMSSMSPQMSTMMRVSDSMFMLIRHYFIALQVQNPNSPPLHNRDDPTSNLLNVVLPGFDYLPFTFLFPMIPMMSYTVDVLITVSGSYESESSQEITE